MRYLLLFALLMLPAMSFAASDFSYVYIQGDKQTPFYVKLEEGMQPRYGKNYCILSRLAPGPAHIEILFQQNAFPAQQFVIQVPERGSREFLIVRRDGMFSLYDLQQGFYLPAGNKPEDDHAPAIAAAVPTPSVSPAADREPEEDHDAAELQPAGHSAPTAFDNSMRKAGQALAKGRDKSAAFARKAVQPLHPATAATDPTATTAPAAGNNGQPSFIGDMELSTPNSDAGTVKTTRPAAGGRAPAPAPIMNSDCPNAMSSADFGKVFTSLSAYTTDEDRLDFFGRQLDKCYETWQARTLAGKMEGDAARFELLKKIYPRITDQAAFPLLDDLLSTPAWKDAFNRLVHR